MSLSPAPRSSGVEETPGRPRVLHVGKFYPPHMGGIETHLETLCQEIRKGTSVDVLVANSTAATVEEHVDGIRVTRLATAIQLAAAPICLGLTRRIADSSADIVHIHLPNPGAVLAFLASGYRGKLIVSYHSDVVRQRFLEVLFRPILLHFLRRADAIVVATPNHIESSNILPSFRERCVVIPYGVVTSPPAEAQDADEVSTIRHRYGNRIVLAVGRLVYYKGFEHLIRAMRSVDAHLLLIGEGPLQEALEGEAAEQGVAGKVTFLGRVDEITPFYRAADVFVLPSVARSEAFGIVQLEAMACGTPVINTSLDSGAPYVSLHDVSGLTVPPGDSSALAEAINRVLGDTTFRERLGRAARDRVEREFCREVMGSRMLDLYHRILGIPNRGAEAGIGDSGRARPNRAAGVS